MPALHLAPLARQRTISEEIGERLGLAIASGEQPPGARITETQIAEAMNVSRAPAREALLNLAARGVLLPIGARGLQVTPVSDGDAANIREVRLGLEGIGVEKAMAASREAPGLLDPLDRIIKEMDGLANGGDMLALAQCDVRFHRTIMELSDNPLLLRIWDDLSAQLLIQFCRDWHGHSDRIGEVELHLRLLALLRSGDCTAIQETLRDHFTGE